MYRNLTQEEIALLEAQGNRADQGWERVEVRHGFRPEGLHNNRFSGTVRLGVFDSGECSPAPLSLPEGITNSWLRDCEVGDHCAIHNVRLLSGYTIGRYVTLFDVGQIVSSSVRPQPATAAVMNENGGREIAISPSMTVGDAYLYAKFRGHERLRQKLYEFSVAAIPPRPFIGDYAVVANCQKLADTYVESAAEMPTVIEGAVAVQASVIGYGCHVVRGCVLRNVLLGENVHIEDMARVSDSVLGDNSTVARCEVGNSLIFPAHEQHHNNSFLIAAAVMGQSNVAAGSTIGSNHNGRTPEGELVTGRGFWPGLCSSFKHPSTFASYCLAAKADYPNELNITLPFSLISNNAAKNCLEVMPAYWWMYNLYALRRNEYKFALRDRRIFRRQHIEFAPLAPDTVEEIVCARELLRHWTEQAYLASPGKAGAIEITANAMERGKRKVVILKAAQAYQAYEDMLYYYIGTVLTEPSASGALDGHSVMDSPLPDASLAGRREVEWVNLGGQLVPRTDLDTLIRDIEQGRLTSWDDIHYRLDTLWTAYPEQKRAHAYRLLCHLNGVSTLTPDLWQRTLARYDAICRHVDQQVRASREKDLADPFRRMTFADDAEMNQVLK